VRLHVLTHEEWTTGVWPAGFSHYIETWRSRRSPSSPPPTMKPAAADIELFNHGDSVIETATPFDHRQSMEAGKTSADV
jgi:hypothetical protein